MAFDVTAVLKANVSNFTGGIKEAQSVFESFQSKSNRTFENLSSGFQKAGTALTAAFTAPAIAGIGAVVKSYASLEQNLGGTQAVFGNFAKSVQNDAKDAYKNMGLSASDYMATANKMGSLFQGSGLDQQRSLELTSKAMQRASDVASVMGIDMNMAMESIAGAAKGNFTMMDNLGVAMNATTLEAYALEKGVNFKWETASNAEKAELAMKMFMDRTKQYDGNFLKESEKTVAGSLDAMKGAFSNFVSGLGDPEADIAKLTDNLKKSIENFAKNVGGVVKTIWDNLPLAPWQKWVAAIAVGTGPVLLALSGVMKGIGTLKAAFQGIGAILSNPFGLAIVSIAALVAGIVYAYKHSEKFRNIVNSAISAVVDKFNELKAKAKPVFDYVKTALSKFDAGSFAPLIGGAGLFAVALKKLKGIKIPNPFSKFKPSFPKIPNPFTGLANMAKSAGSAIKNAFSGIGKSIGSIFKGIGSAVSTAFQGIAKAISMLNPAGIASFAVGLAAVTAALMALSSMQGTVIPFLQGLSAVFVQLVGGVLQAFVASLVSLAPVMTTIATALTTLSPLVVAFGQAFSMVAAAIGASLPGIITAISGLVTAIGGAVSQIVTAMAPIIQIFSTTFVQLVSIISNAVVQIVQALAPYIPSITQMFTTIATVVANAIVAIIQALAPFIPAISQMVQAVAPVLQSLVQAFTTLVTQISPIIDSLTQLFQTLGEQISSILESAGSVVESFGSAIRNVLDGVAGIFDSLGNAALNAGKGVKLMAQGIKILVGLNLVDLGATLATVAAGLVAIVASGIGGAGEGLKQAGQGLRLIATSSQAASVSIQTLPTAFSVLTTSLGSLPATLTATSTSMRAFSTGIVTSISGLLNVGSIIARFSAMLISIGPSLNIASSGLSVFNRQSNASSNAMRRLGTASAQALAQVRGLGAGITLSMSSATSSIIRAGAQMSAALRLAGSQMTITIRSAGTQMVTTIQATMNHMKSVVQSGVSSMVASVRNGGSQMASAWNSSGRQLVSYTQSFVNSANAALRGVGSGVSLYSNGLSLMQGLQSGIDVGWGAIQGKVSSMAQWIKDHKGPVSYDKRLLIDNGLAIMSGLFRGISSGWSKVQGLISPMADRISAFVSGGMAGNFALPSVSTVLGSSLTVNHTPQSVSHSIDSVSSQQSIADKLDILIDEAKKGHVIYMDDREVGNIIDQRLGQNTNLGGRFAW